MGDAEDRRDRIERRLRATEERFRLAQIASGIGWFEWDLSANTWEWTPPVTTLFGFAEGAPGPSFADWEQVIFADDVPKLRAAAQGAAETGSYYVEFRVKHPDNSLHWIAGKGEATNDDAGQRWIAGVYYEITERKALEARLLALNETLEARVAEEIKRRQQMEDALRQAQKMEVIGQLTGGVAHDFNNLLMVILGNLETMQRRLPVEHELQRMVTAALGGASRAAQLTQRLLAFARRQPLVPELLSPNRLIAGMSDLLRRALGESFGLETVLTARIWNIFADANQLENALINLVVNSRDAMPEGGRVAIETANCYLDEAYCVAQGDVTAGEYVGIFVGDTGIGMPPDIINKAFEPFFTTKEVQGTGLGLSQVYGFVKQSGGHVKIYSKIGEGTTVKLYFPRHLGAGDRLAVAQDEKPSPRARKGEMVLIVEDDPDVRDYTVDVTKELGYAVVSAPNGSIALELLDRHPELQLLFTDVGLPGMDGRQLADEAVRRRPDIKILFTTGYARDAIVHDGRLDPGLEVVFKPFSYSDLAVKIRRVFDS
jgi:signal transduction histidine kinase/CheY-like chemotaxis protein